MFLNDNKLAGSNEICDFYQNSMTNAAEEWAKGKGLLGVKCLLAVNKTSNEKDYLLVRKGVVIHENKQYEALAAHIDIMALVEAK